MQKTILVLACATLVIFHGYGHRLESRRLASWSNPFQDEHKSHEYLFWHPHAKGQKASKSKRSFASILLAFHPAPALHPKQTTLSRSQLHYSCERSAPIVLTEKAVGKPLKAAVIIPGFLNDRKDFEPLARSLSARGLPTAVVPMPLWHWIPQLGGRSVRPILERIDYAVRYVASLGEVETSSPLEVPPIHYSVFDFLQDQAANPGGLFKVGGSDRPEEYPNDIEPCGKFPSCGPPQGRIALIAHSASGWIARIYLGDRAYGGKSYAGAEFVHSLVTLGTPHLVGKGVPFYSVGWANKASFPSSVRCLLVGSRGIPDSIAIGAGYSFSNPDGCEFLDGDGVTPIESAIGLPDAEKLVLDNVSHYPWTVTPFADLIAPELTQLYREGMPWYGSESVLCKWLPWLLQGAENT